jgi:hypothetical protein
MEYLVVSWKAMDLSILEGSVFRMRGRTMSRERPDPPSFVKEKPENSRVLDNVQMVSRECPGGMAHVDTARPWEECDGSAERETGIK